MYFQDSGRYYLQRLIRKMARSSSKVRNWVNMQLDTRSNFGRLGRDFEGLPELSEIEKASRPARA